MKINVLKYTLVKALTTAQKAVSTKGLNPIMQCFLIEAKDGKIKVTGNDLELGIEATISTGLVSEEGRFCVEAKLFSDIIRKLPDTDISLELENNVLKIKADKAKFNISVMDADKFSEIPNVEKETGIQLSQMALRDVIRQTIFATSDNEASKMMTGEHIEVNSNVLTITALDGHRIAQRKVELGGTNPDVDIVIPAKTLSEIIKIIGSDADKMVNISFTKSHALFEFDETRVVSRLLDGTYYNVKTMLQMAPPIHVRVDRKDLLATMDRATLLIQATDTKPVILTIKDDNVMYVRLNTSLGSMNEEISVEKQGPEVVIGLNNRFIIEVLNSIEEDEVDIYFDGSKMPCLVKSDTYLYVVLPISIGNVATA